MSNIFVEREAALRRQRKKGNYSDAYLHMLRSTVDGSKARTAAAA